MSIISDNLRKEAKELQTAQDQIDWQQSKIAATQVLCSSGLTTQDASLVLTGFEGLVKSASDAHLNSFAHYSETMLKTAAYIDQLEAKIAETDTELTASKMQKQATMVRSLSSKGFEQEEIERIVSSLPSKTLEKMAGVSEPAWDMGRVVSNNDFNGSGQMDCVTEWLLKGTI